METSSLSEAGMPLVSEAGTQTVSVSEAGTQTDTRTSSSSMCTPPEARQPLSLAALAGRVSDAVQRLEFDLESFGTPSLISECRPELHVAIPDGCSPLRIVTTVPSKGKSWLLNYTALAFLMNGQLFAEYHRVAIMLGLPLCSGKHWQQVVSWLCTSVTKLAEWSCSQVRDLVCKRGDRDAWVTSYDGFYLTRGHYSNNSSATLHDYASGGIAWFRHRTKRGKGHNWEGTSGGAEADMLDDILSAAKDAGFTISEIVTDKDSSMNAIYCRHFPEGTITYCSNHSAKTLHKDLHKVKTLKCEVGEFHICRKENSYFIQGSISMYIQCML